jgi:acyl-CoA synthetase (AMP-forming)/AMP-acid ligase II
VSPSAGPEAGPEDPPADPEDPRADLLYASVPGLVAAAAERFGDAEALVDGERRLSFSQLEGEALAVSGAAMAAGIGPGDRVAIWAPNMAEWVLAALGLLGVGAVLVPLNTRFKGPEAAYVLKRSGAKALFTVRGFLGHDYPAMLEEQDVPDLERIVLLRDDAGTFSEPTSSDEVPIFGWHEFLAGAEGVVESEGLVVGHHTEAAEVMAAWRAVTGGDLSDIIFTSGTTGRPKGATTTHAQTLRTFATWAAIVGLAEGDRYLIVNPFFHTFGYKAGIIACLLAGATIVPEPVFDVDRVLERVAAEKITMLPGPPTLYQSILDHPRRDDYDLSSLRLAVTGAAAVPVELISRMRSELTFATVLTAYGLTESTGVVTMCRQGDDPDVISHTSGRAIPDTEVRIVDEAGTERPRGEPGEIVVRGYTVVSGYYQDPEATAAAIDADRFLHTGDIGLMDEAGNVTITDRLKDMFIVGGFNAYPAEIEGALLRHPAVSQVAVIGVPDPRLGEVGCAFVVPRPDAAPDPDALAAELCAWAREQMANYKVPRTVQIVEALPLNASGKVLKTELRARMTASDGAARDGADRGRS